MSKTLQTVNKCKSGGCGLEFSLVVLHRPSNNFSVATSCPMCRCEVELIHSMMLEVETPEREKHEATVSLRRRPIDVAEAQHARDSVMNEIIELVEESGNRLDPSRLEDLRTQFRNVMQQFNQANPERSF